LVLFARESLRDPNLALTFRDLKEDIAWPKQYERAKKVNFVKHMSQVLSLFT
jgi:hypothetical protein